jgi:hypothetical protein
MEVPNVRTDGYVDAAEALSLLGDHAGAIDHAREALELAHAKGNLSRAAQVQALIDRELEAAAPSLAQ